MKSRKAVRVKIPRVRRPRMRSATVMRVNPAASESGLMTKWIIPRNLGAIVGIPGRLMRFMSQPSPSGAEKAI